MSAGDVMMYVVPAVVAGLVTGFIVRPIMQRQATMARASEDAMSTVATKEFNSSHLDSASDVQLSAVSLFSIVRPRAGGLFVAFFTIVFTAICIWGSIDTATKPETRAGDTTFTVVSAVFGVVIGVGGIFLTVAMLRWRVSVTADAITMRPGLGAERFLRFRDIGYVRCFERSRAKMMAICDSGGRDFAQVPSVYTGYGLLVERLRIMRPDLMRNLSDDMLGC